MMPQEHQTAITLISLDKIIPDPNNENIHTQKDIRKRANQIKKVGLLHPIRVRPIKNSGGMYMIIFGEGRWRAFRLLGLESIPAQIFIVDDKEAARMRYIENFGKTNFTMLADCKSCANLFKQGDTVREIANATGQKIGTLKAKIAIGHFPQEITELLLGGQWGLMKLEEILGLRMNKSGTISPPEGGWLLFPEKIDYTEVVKVIELVNSGTLKGFNDIRTYVQKRRDELKEQELDKAAKDLQIAQEQIGEQMEVQDNNPNQHTDVEQDIRDFEALRSHYEALILEKDVRNEVRLDKAINSLKKHSAQIANLLILLASEQSGLLDDRQSQELYMELYLLREKLGKAMSELGSEFSDSVTYGHQNNRRLPNEIKE